MPGQTKTLALRRNPAWDGPQRPQRHPRRKTAASAPPASALHVDRMLDAVGRSIPLDNIELPEEFFPAHLSVALVDAVFRFRLGPEEQPAPPAEQYCSHFGITRRRTGLWELPGADEQETLADLMSHYDRLGVDSMANEVFRSRSCFPATAIPRAEYVLCVANALRGVGVDSLHDVQARGPEKIAEALDPLPGSDEHFVRMLLTYAGDDDFSQGDEPVRQFVAHALGRNTISTRRAVNLVRETAYELILSPRYLDYQIWRYGIALTH